MVSTILPDFEVRSEHTEAEGLNRAATEKFDVILADFYLPDGTGLELCQLIRAFDPTTPILVITARTELLTNRSSQSVDRE